MKLHLGCGERYLDGYVNIDFPSDNHTIQKKSVADRYANIKELQFSDKSIEEVRLHHVFEHFDRVEAISFLIGWNNWLVPKGRVHIEVPDLFWTSIFALTPFLSRKKRLVATRHIFGSHEASWAIHCEGWTASSLSYVMRKLGYRIDNVKRAYWRGTFNLEIFASKERELSDAELQVNLIEIFDKYILDHSPGELELRQVWISKVNLMVSKMRIA